MAQSSIDPGLIARLGEVWQRTLPLLGPEARRELEAVVSPKSLAVLAGVVVAWVVSHAFGVGEIVDFLIGMVGFLSLGAAVFSGLDHLFGFALVTYRGRTPGELDHAARELAEAIAILGVTAVLAILFRGRPRTFKGSKINLGPEPPRTPGIRYKPTTTAVQGAKPGEGFTSSWGDVEYSASGSASDQALVRVHEKVHQFLTPKLYLLRRFRIEQRMASYFRSSLSRWL